MNAELKKKWLDALRSGKYRQGSRKLRYKNGDGEDCKYCCLGVLYDVVGRRWEQHFGLIDERILDMETQFVLIAMNDGDGAAFAEIADWIEANITTEQEAP